MRIRITIFLFYFSFCFIQCFIIETENIFVLLCRHNIYHSGYLTSSMRTRENHPQCFPQNKIFRCSSVEEWQWEVEEIVIFESHSNVVRCEWLTWKLGQITMIECENVHLPPGNKMNIFAVISFFFVFFFLFGSCYLCYGVVIWLYWCD